MDEIVQHDDWERIYMHEIFLYNYIHAPLRVCVRNPVENVSREKPINDLMQHKIFTVLLLCMSKILSKYLIQENKCLHQSDCPIIINFQSPDESQVKTQVYHRAFIFFPKLFKKIYYTYWMSHHLAEDITSFVAWFDSVLQRCC